MGRFRKTGIRLAIERRLIPELQARGFSAAGDLSDPQLEPFGRFLRRTERGIEIVVIHFNKNRTSHFHFRVARAIQPVSWFNGVVAIEDQWPHHVRPNFTVWRRGLVFRRWFGVKKYAREGISEAEFDAAAAVAVQYLRVIERFFATGRRTMYVQEFPQGVVEDLPYWVFCFVVVLAPFCAALWLLGWIVRHL